MFNKYIKLVIATGISIWAIFQFIDGNIMNGISLLLLLTTKHPFLNVYADGGHVTSHVRTQTSYQISAPPPLPQNNILRPEYYAFS